MMQEEYLFVGPFSLLYIPFLQITAMCVVKQLWGLLRTPSESCVSKQLPTGNFPSSGKFHVPNIQLFILFFWHIAARISHLTGTIQIWQNTFVRTKNSFFITSEDKRSLAKSIPGDADRPWSLSDFHASMWHVRNAVLHSPAVTGIHSGNPCRAWVIVF